MAGPSTAGSSHRKSTSSRSTKKEVPKHKSSRSHKTNDSLPRNSGNETHDWSEWVYSDEYSRYYRTRVDSQGMLTNANATNGCQISYRILDFSVEISLLAISQYTLSNVWWPLRQ